MDLFHWIDGDPGHWHLVALTSESESKFLMASCFDTLWHALNLGWTQSQSLDQSHPERYPSFASSGLMMLELDLADFRRPPQSWRVTEALAALNGFWYPQTPEIVAFGHRCDHQFAVYHHWWTPKVELSWHAALLVAFSCQLRKIRRLKRAVHHRQLRRNLLVQCTWNVSGCLNSRHCVESLT